MKQVVVKIVFGCFVFGLALLSFGYNTLEAISGAVCFGIVAFVTAAMISKHK